MTKGRSGEHPAVIEFQKQMEAIAEDTIPKIDEAIEKANQTLSSHPPAPEEEIVEEPIPRNPGVTPEEVEENEDEKATPVVVVPVIPVVVVEEEKDK